MSLKLVITIYLIIVLAMLIGGYIAGGVFSIGWLMAIIGWEAGNRSDLPGIAKLVWLFPVGAIITVAGLAMIIMRLTA